MSATGVPGRVVVLTGPSGAGIRLVAAALQRLDGRWRAGASVTTRPQRPDEAAAARRFLDAAGFDALAATGGLVETTDVCGHRYGVARADVQAALDAGEVLLLVLDGEAAAAVRDAVAAALVVEVLPPPGLGPSGAAAGDRRYDLRVTNDDPQRCAAAVHAFVAATAGDNAAEG